MGWVNRNGRRYYYRKVCHGHQVRAIYVGSGPLADIIAAEDAQRAAARRAAVADRAAHRTIAAEAEVATAPVARIVEALAVASLLLTGHHYAGQSG